MSINHLTKTKPTMNNDNFYPAPTIETVEPEIVTRSPFIL